MRAARHFSLAVLALASFALVLPTEPARAQAPPAATQSPASQPQSLVDQLMGVDAPAADVDVAALRQQAADRVQSKADAVALRRPPIAPQLLKLPHADFDVVFDPDTAVIRPQSYQVIGRIADALSDPKLRPYAFLVISHTEATGPRAANLTLSQRRAEAIRQVLANGFRISSAQLQALGLGEEQLQASSRPASQASVRAQIVTLGKVAEVEPAAGGAPAAKKGAAKKKRQ